MPGDELVPDAGATPRPDPGPAPRPGAYERLVRLQEVGVRLTAARTTQDVTAVVLDEMADSVGAAASALSLLDPDGATVRVAGARGFPPDMVPVSSFRSIAFTLAARTAIRIFPGPACGSGASAHSRASGPP